MKSGIKYVIGIDEVGRGPIAGPMTLCAFKMLCGASFYQFRGVKDSKKHTFEEREKWFSVIKKTRKNGLIDFALSHVSSSVIDRKGLTYAAYLAIYRSLRKLRVKERECIILLDGGLKAPKNFTNQKTVIKGDEKVKAIGLASIVAKVKRDRIMVRFSRKYAEYGFEKHKGYGTKEHYAALKKFGLSPIHRKSFLD